MTQNQPVPKPDNRKEVADAIHIARKAIGEMIAYIKTHEIDPVYMRKLLLDANEYLMAIEIGTWELNATLDWLQRTVIEVMAQRDDAIGDRDALSELYILEKMKSE